MTLPSSIQSWLRRLGHRAGIVQRVRHQLACLCVVFLSTQCAFPDFAVSPESCYTIIVNPGEDASRQARFNWHADTTGFNACYVTEVSDSLWSNARRIHAQEARVDAFDDVYSITSHSQNIYEHPHIVRYTAQIDALTPGTEYKYRIIGYDGPEGRFKTAPEATDGWTAALISDMHTYTPLPARRQSAMDMLGTLREVNGGDFDILLHAGDLCAWGGSYSFWVDLYAQPEFRNHMVSGVIGNHDYMSRDFLKCSEDYFRYCNNNPRNGYGDEIGVCYTFTYGSTRFIMLSSEAMATDEGYEQAREWVCSVLDSATEDMVVVIEHYQWFSGENGNTAQYSRWWKIFDDYGVDLAIAGNNHIYVRTAPLRGGKKVDEGEGTIYVQTTASDNERGRDFGEQINNFDRIEMRWTEGPHSVSALLLKYLDGKLYVALYDRKGNVIDSFTAGGNRKNRKTN